MGERERAGPGPAVAGRRLDRAVGRLAVPPEDLLPAVGAGRPALSANIAAFDVPSPIAAGMMCGIG